MRVPIKPVPGNSAHSRPPCYVEGRNVRFVYRFADGYLDRLPALAAELVQLNPRLIVSAPVPAKRPIKFERVINLKTAKTLGVEIPQMLLVRANEVVE
jgi:GTP:adenosylcobinamide-phosphate guanylyltransferase